ncbi:hypothetical protein SAMN05216459_12427 [Ensifer sp. OV372]|nr:hypothetical protein SAMN05216459_12427 [Ensifer sp. OV372]
MPSALSQSQNGRGFAASSSNSGNSTRSLPLTSNVARPWRRRPKSSQSPKSRKSPSVRSPRVCSMPFSRTCGSEAYFVRTLGGQISVPRISAPILFWESKVILISTIVGVVEPAASFILASSSRRAARSGIARSGVARFRSRISSNRTSTYCSIVIAVLISEISTRLYEAGETRRCTRAASQAAASGDTVFAGSRPATRS